VTFRSPRLLASCRELACQSCGRDDGTVVAAHANWSDYGKGKSLKASDAAVAALCFSCHHELDQGAHLDKAERRAMWVNAHSKTMVALIERGLLKVA
jgi:hypothetical protein